MRRRLRSATSVLGECGEESRRGPAFLVGLLGELFPRQLDGGQAQFGEQQFETRFRMKPPLDVTSTRASS
jgi:hypothetical protein